MVVSCTLPAVSRTTSSRPAPSDRACTLVVSPPRDRPMAWSPGSPITGSTAHLMSVASAAGCSAVGCSAVGCSASPIALLVGVGGRGVPAEPAGGGAVLVDPHHRGVRRDQPVQLPGCIGVSLRASQESGPRAIGAPAGQPLVGGLPWPKPLRHLPPRRTGPVLPGDRLDHLPVIPPPPTSPTAEDGGSGSIHAHASSETRV